MLKMGFAFFIIGIIFAFVAAMVGLSERFTLNIASQGLVTLSFAVLSSVCFICSVLLFRVLYGK